MLGIIKNFKFLIALSAGPLLLTYFAIKQYFKRKKYSHIPGPATKGILEYFLGNFNELNQAIKDGIIVPEKYLEWSRLYGPVFKFQLLDNFIIVTNDPEAVKEITLVRDFPKAKLVYQISGYPYNERFLGNGLVTEVDKEKWKKKRALFNPSYTKSVLMNLIKEFNAKSDILIEKLRTLADGKTSVNLFKHINRMTLDIISSVAFGINTDSINDPKNQLNVFVSKSMEGLNTLFMDPLIGFQPLKFKLIREYKNAIINLREFGKNVILERIKQIESGEYALNDVLSLVLQSCDKNDIDLELIVDDFVSFITGGQETTANALAFCILELVRNPRVLKKAKEEIDEVLGVRTEVKSEDIHKLEYVGCVFKEVLRKFPPAVQFVRETDGEFSINGYSIPIGSIIAVSPYLMGRTSEYFENPEQFIPERFMQSSSYEIKKHTYIPFSMGYRSCIGQNFAHIEGKIALVKLIQNFEFELDPNQCTDPIEVLTLRPKDGCRCFLVPRC